MSEAGAFHYLNHAGTSFPKPESVGEAVSKALRASPTEHARLYDSAFSKVKSEFRAAGKGDPFRVVVTSGCTAGLALALGDVPWQAGDFLLTSSYEHHALDRVAQSLELSRDIVRLSLEPSEHELLDLARLESLLDSKPVRLVALTHTSNVTGERLPLAEIAKLTRRSGAALLVDAAQTFGTSLFDEAVRSADIIVCAGHKSALGPQGIGVLAARASFSFQVPGAACELGEKACGSFPGFCDAGSVNLAALAGLAEGLSWSREAGRGALLEKAQAFAARLRRFVHQSSRFELLGAQEHDGLPTVSLISRGQSLSELAAFLQERGVWARAGTHCAPAALSTLGHADGCLRLSFGPMSTEKDLLAAEAALSQFEK